MTHRILASAACAILTTVVACAGANDESSAGSASDLSASAGGGIGGSAGGEHPVAPSAPGGSSSAQPTDAQAQACFTKCLGTDQKAAQIVKAAVKCSEKCKPNDDACAQKCDDMTDKLCTDAANTSACAKLDQCSQQCFADGSEPDSMMNDCSAGDDDDDAYGDYDDYGDDSYSGGYGDDSYYFDPKYNDGRVDRFDGCQADWMQDRFSSSTPTRRR